MMKITEERKATRRTLEDIREARKSAVMSLREKGYTIKAIAVALNLPESTIIGYIKQD